MPFSLTATPFDLDAGGLGYRAVTVADLRARGVDEDQILAGVRAHLKDRVDAEAEAMRARVVTPGAGQALEYQEAQAQAEAALALPKTKPPAAGDFPMLDATVGIDVDPTTGQPATDVLGVARSVQAAYGAWRGLGAEIRKARLAGKAAIDAAASIEAATAAVSAIAWPSLGN